jgi:hypothetical protein
MDHMIVLAGEITFRTFHLNDTRAGISQSTGALRRRNCLLDRDDKEAG